MPFASLYSLHAHTKDIWPAYSSCCFIFKRSIPFTPTVPWNSSHRLQNALMPRYLVISANSHCIDSASVIRPSSISSFARSSVCAWLETSYPCCWRSLMNSPMFYWGIFSPNCLSCLCDHSSNLKRQSQGVPLPRLFTPSWFFKQDPDPHHSPKILVDLQGVEPL